MSVEPTAYLIPNGSNLGIVARTKHHAEQLSSDFGDGRPIVPLYAEPTNADQRITELAALCANLITENAGLKNRIDALQSRINNGMRVYANKHEDNDGYLFIDPYPDIPTNAILILDDQGDK
jgi:hypothetical protein